MLPSSPARSDADEITATLRDLIESFGESQVSASLGDLGLSQSATVGTEQVLRRFTLLLLESKHPRAVAMIVARLCNLDTATGREIRQEDIGRLIGVSKQAVCNLESKLAAELNLPRRSSPKARQSHRLMNRRNYAHHAGQPYPTLPQPIKTP